MAASHDSYYLPEPSRWPITGSIGLFLLLGGFAMLLNGSPIGKWSMIVGAVIVIHMLFGWFGTVIKESEAGDYNDQVDISFRWGMGWFIFSEVLFFAAFFGALFYIRVLSVPWLGGEGAGGAAGAGTGRGSDTGSKGSGLLAIQTNRVGTPAQLPIV